MPLHLIKLAVGAETVSGLIAWQKERLKEMRRNGEKPELIHVTRHAPKRAEEILDDGSLYWVVKGWIAVRQKLREIRPVTKDGITQSGLVLHKEVVAVEPRPCRAFQGWRYLEAKDAPPDRSKWGKEDDLPDALRRELISLGLL